jgi:hypothetical protein
VNVYNRYYEHLEIGKKKFIFPISAYNVKLFIPLIAEEVDAYGVRVLTGIALEENWKASGEMLFGAIGYKRNPAWVQTLIDRGADINYRNPSDRYTPLLRAIKNNYYETAKVLLRAGVRADLITPLKYNEKGVSPISLIMAKYKDWEQKVAYFEMREMLKIIENGWQAENRYIKNIIESGRKEYLQKQINDLN